MGPRTTRRQIQPHVPQNHVGGSPADDHGLFIDPMLGSPLPLYIEKDVVDKDQLVDIIKVQLLMAYI